MLIVRGTKKLRDRVKATPAAGPDDESTTLLGDWFVNALFWKPQVAMLVNSRTFLPVYLPLAPAKTLLDRQAREAQGAGAATPLRLQAFAIQNDKDASMVFGLGEDGMLYFAPLDNLHGRRQWRLWPVYPPA